MTRPSDKPEHIALSQTTESLLAKQAVGEQSVASREQLFGQPFLLPGADNLTIGSMAPHSAIVGSTGAGKTNVQKLLMNCVLPSSHKYGGLRFRSVVYDPKRELYPYLCDIGIPESQIVVTHPFDARSAAWDLAADFTEPAQIEELAEMIVPENRSESASANQFFETSARIIVQDVIEGLIANRGRDWDLRDIVQTVSKIEYLRAVLFQTENGIATWNMFLSTIDDGRDSRLAMNIMATLRSYARPFHSLAALWHRAETKFSIGKWAKGAGLLLLGADPQRQRTLQRVNQLLVRRLSQVLLSRNDENPVDLTWWFIDEVREAGRLDGLRQLLNEGRSKGVRVVLGFQDIEGLYSLYEKHEAEEMVGLCANRVFLHVDNPGTRQWASDFLGEAEEEIPEYSRTEGKESTQTTTLKIDMRTNALPIEFHSLPLASPAVGVVGWYAIPGRRNRFVLDPHFLNKVLFPGNHPLPDAFVPRSVSSQHLPEWKDNDLFGLDIVSDKSPELNQRKRSKLSVPPHFQPDQGF